MNNPTILDKITASKRMEIEAARAKLPEAELEARALAQSPPRDFLAPLRDPPGVRILAEVKRASPSAGAIKAHADSVAQALSYELAGAACISVLTDMPFFHGTLDDLRRVRAAVSIPVLRKDFILDRYQVLEAREAGADAVLLIAEILDDEQLQRLSAEILRWGMTPLVELYDAENVDRVVHSGAKLIGINNRDLRSFVTRLEHTVELASRIPKDRCLVSESGIRTRADVEMVRRAGAKAILVGETLMRAENLAEKMAELACP